MDLPELPEGFSWEQREGVLGYDGEVLLVRTANLRFKYRAAITKDNFVEVCRGNSWARPVQVDNPVEYVAALVWAGEIK